MINLLDKLEKKTNIVILDSKKSIECGGYGWYSR